MSSETRVLGRAGELLGLDGNVAAATEILWQTGGDSLSRRDRAPRTED